MLLVFPGMFLVWAPRGAPRSRIFSEYTWGGVGWGCVHVPSACTLGCCTRHECYGRTKRKLMRLWTTDANRLQITVNLKKMRHLRRAFQRFCASSHPSYKCYMLENLVFFHNSSKTLDDADIANGKRYSAPAGALTMFLFLYFPLYRIINNFGNATAFRKSFKPVSIFLCDTDLKFIRNDFSRLSVDFLLVFRQKWKLSIIIFINMTPICLNGLRVCERTISEIVFSNFFNVCVVEKRWTKSISGLVSVQISDLLST